MLMLRRPPVCPYIIEMYEWFDRPLVFSLVLEFPQPCVTLREFIMDSSGLSEAVARGFMRQLVLAVQHCINHGVFHNDVHADNVLVNTDTLELKLIDFGSGHLLDSAGYDSVKYIGELPFLLHCDLFCFLKNINHTMSFFQEHSCSAHQRSSPNPNTTPSQQTSGL